MDENYTIELAHGELQMIEVALREWRMRTTPEAMASLMLDELILKLAHKNSAIMSSDPAWVDA